MPRPAASAAARPAAGTLGAHLHAFGASMRATRLLPTALAAASLFGTLNALAQEAAALERVTVLGSRKSLPAASSTEMWPRR